MGNSLKNLVWNHLCRWDRLQSPPAAFSSFDIILLLNCNPGERSQALILFSEKLNYIKIGDMARLSMIQPSIKWQSNLNFYRSHYDLQRWTRILYVFVKYVKHAGCKRQDLLKFLPSKIAQNFAGLFGRTFSWNGGHWFLSVFLKRFNCSHTISTRTGIKKISPVNIKFVPRRYKMTWADKTYDI